jgi:hypothetical protein
LFVVLFFACLREPLTPLAWPVKIPNASRYRLIRPSCLHKAKKGKENTWQGKRVGAYVVYRRQTVRKICLHKATMTNSHFRPEVLTQLEKAFKAKGLLKITRGIAAHEPMFELFSLRAASLGWPFSVYNRLVLLEEIINSGWALPEDCEAARILKTIIETDANHELPRRRNAVSRRR